jgi:uncharacterized membrane protein YqjE
MPEPHDSGAHRPGLFNHAAEWLGTLLAYLRARIALAEIEGREAAVHYAILAALAVAGLALLFVGYLFACLALVCFIAWALGGGNAWAWVSLGMAVLHVLIAGGLLVWARLKLARPMFGATLDELRKDHEWLTSTTAKRP